MEKADMLRAVLAQSEEIRAAERAAKKSAPKEKDNTWKKIIAAYNEEYVKKYQVIGATGPAYKLQASANKIIRTFAGDVARAVEYTKFFVEFYEELPFVNPNKFKRPLLGGIATFADRLVEYKQNRDSYVSQAELMQAYGDSGAIVKREVY